jgi:hypothetical protein
MQDLHDAEFKKTDCLKCACCKTTGPLFTLADIERVSNILSKTTAVYSAISSY